jgi:hypothetical protein
VQQFTYLGKDVVPLVRPHVCKIYLGNQCYPSCLELCPVFKAQAPEISKTITQAADYQAFQALVGKFFLAVAGKCGI